MAVFQFGVWVAAPPAVERGRWEPVTRRAVAAEPVVLAPLARGRCADAVVEGGPSGRRALVYFDREAANLPAALVTAVLDLEHDGLDCRAVVPDDDLVTLGVFAARLGVTPRAARAVAPDAPALRCGGERVFRWSDLAARLPAASGAASEPVLAALNLALRLRQSVRSDPALVEAVRNLLAA